MLVCALAIFELTFLAIVVLLVVSLRNTKKLGNSYGEDMCALTAVIDTFTHEINTRLGVINAEIDKGNRQFVAFKNDFDTKFGEDLVKKLNAIFKLGEHPDRLVIGEDGQFHKITPGY